MHSAIHRRVIGNVREGQGYADKRKRKFLNNYQKLRRKQRLHKLKCSGSKEAEAPEGIEPKEREETAQSQRTTSDGHSLVRGTESSAGSEKSLLERSGEDVKKKFKKRGGKKNSRNRFSRVQEEFIRMKKEEQMRTEVSRRQKEERTQALADYQSKKQARHSRLSKRTRRGQPVMKHQMEVLLEKIKTQSGR